MHWNYGLVRPSKTIDKGNGIKLNVAEKKNILRRCNQYASLQILFEMITEGICTLKQSLDYAL